MASYKNDSARIAPASPPLQPDMQEPIDAIMRGAPPLVLFMTLARDRRLFFKFFNSGLLDRGNLTIRQREIVIDRVTASCGAEYEWGVHVSVFAEKAGLTESADRLAGQRWTRRRLLGRRGSGPDPAVRRPPAVLHSRRRARTLLAAHHSDEAILELLMLAGTYRIVSYLVNGLRLPLEPGARRFPA